MIDLADNKTHIVLVNALVVKNEKILISQRSFEETHEPGKWTIPGGKVERDNGNVWSALEKTLAREVEEETGVKIKRKMELLMNNTFIRNTGYHVVALVFLCFWKSGEPRPMEDTINVKWIFKNELNNFEFPKNVKEYILKGFKRIKSK